MKLSISITGGACTILSTLIIILTFSTTVINGQYETPNHMCGGWFKSVRGSIDFKYNPDANETILGKEHVCAWTVSGYSANQYSKYDISIQQIAGYVCDPTTTKIGVSHFNLHSQDVTATETWNCGGPQQWRAVPGTVFIVVWKTTNMRNMSGFHLDWVPNGDILSRNGVRTTYYSWGKHDIQPLPYYASGFFKEEVATHVFPKGNNTNGYALEMVFDTIDLTQCGPEEDLSPCSGANSSLLIFTIEDDARLRFGQQYLGPNLDEPTVPIKSAWGLVILVWAGDFWGAGGRFQMAYRSVIMSE